MVTALGDGVEVEGLASVPDGRLVSPPQQTTAIQVDEDTLAVMRVERLASGNILTVTYAAPDYLFETKPALKMLDEIIRRSKLLN
jgi:hypothetical protein